MSAGTLFRVLSPFTNDTITRPCAEITTARFYADGFTGADHSADSRAELARYLSLPEDISAKALLRAVNLLSLTEEYEAFIKIKTASE